MGWLLVLFFLSGFPALLYQLVWQGSLFTIYGVNSESITVVVSAFLLGLGIGSLAGGWLSRRRPLPLLMMFGLIEIGIGLFGFCSLPLFRAVGAATLGASTGWTFFFSFCLVVFPTLLMGATLPILTEYLVRRYRNVGRSVGLLYAVNTLGSAVACFAAALFLLGALGQSGTVSLAGALNLVAGSLALLLHLKGPRIKAKHAAATHAASEGPTPTRMRLRPALLLAFLTGFVALSYEIVWARVYDFLSQGRATAFPLMLGSFLFGIAGGSLLARRFCRSKSKPLLALAYFVLAANAAGFLIIPALVFSGPVLHYWTSTLLLVAGAAAMLGATFPLLCHIAIPPEARAGARLSYMYVANIAGSVVGGLTTGFYLLDWWSLKTIAVVLSWIGLALGAGLFLAARVRGRALALRLGASAVAALLILALAGPVFDPAYRRLLFKWPLPETRLTHIVENRSGVVVVDSDRRIYGTGAYDGAYNTDPTGPDINSVYRAYMLSAFHPDPEEVLVIGMSSGSWSMVLAEHPQVKRLTIVEINPGYLELLEEFDDVKGLPGHPKVEIVVDDGRRWLAANPDRKFDAIVSNTTYTWRAHMSNLLSLEFFDLCRKHLKPGGVLYYNATGSRWAQKTGAYGWPYACRFTSMMVCSDRPIDWDRRRWRETMYAYRRGGRPVFVRGHPAHEKRLDELIGKLDHVAPATPENKFASFEPREMILARTLDCEPITDDNMGVEFLIPPPAPFPLPWKKAAR